VEDKTNQARMGKTEEREDAKEKKERVWETDN